MQSKGELGYLYNKCADALHTTLERCTADTYYSIESVWDRTALCHAV